MKKTAKVVVLNPFFLFNTISVPINTHYFLPNRAAGNMFAEVATVESDGSGYRALNKNGLLYVN